MDAARILIHCEHMMSRRVRLTINNITVIEGNVDGWKIEQGNGIPLPSAKGYLRIQGLDGWYEMTTLEDVGHRKMSLEEP